MKRVLLVLATLVLLTTATVPSFADGNPMPICTSKVCGA
jgi:hypothetical protein